jgi:hypothetical protein
MVADWLIATTFRTVIELSIAVCDRPRCGSWLIAAAAVPQSVHVIYVRWGGKDNLWSLSFDFRSEIWSSARPTLYRVQ